MKRFYLVRWEQRNYKKTNYFNKDFVSYGALFENKADALSYFERVKLSADMPKVQVWEQLRKNDGYVQAQRRLAIKEFNSAANAAFSNIVE